MPSSSLTDLPILAVDAARLGVEVAGIENYLLQLLPPLARRWREGGGEVTVFASHPEIFAGLQGASIQRGGGTGWTQLRLPIAAARSHAAVYFTPIPILPQLLPMPCPAVVTVHDLHEFRPRWSYFRRLLERTLDRASGVVCVSDATRAEVLEEFPGVSAKVVTIREAADPAIFTADGSTGLEAPVFARLGLRERPLLAVGTIQPRKNYARLITAYAALPAGVPPLVIVGRSGWDYAEVAALPAQLGVADRVIFTGHLRDAEIADLMRGAQLLCALSTAEGFGLPLVEAMCCGTPILAADIPPFREVAGSAAVFVDPLDTDAISARLQALIGDPSRLAELSRLGLARRSLFSWETAAAEVEVLLRRAVPGGRI
ncbi:MAG: glycosyltransferase family 4 protein [Candidatus Dormibacteria bacterium]